MKRTSFHHHLMYWLCVATLFCVTGVQANESEVPESLEQERKVKIANPFENHLKEKVEQMMAEGKEVPRKLMQLYKGEAINSSGKTLNNLSIAQLSLVEEKLDKKSKDEKGCKKKEKCGKVIPITKKDIDHKGFVINKSGHYCLAENVVFRPKADNVAAITINANFVTLDLGGHILSQSTNTFLLFNNTTAILINPGSSFVTIQNGTIQNFANMGIFAKSLNLTDGDHQGILVKEMTVLNCGKITTAPTDRLLSYRSAIGIDGAKEVVVKNCLTSGILGTYTDGIGTVFSDDVLIKNCRAVDHVGQVLGAGINCFVGSDILIKDCEALRISGLDMGLNGINLDFCSNGIIDGCNASNNVTNKTSFVVSPNLVQAIGINVPFPSENIIISNCTINDNSSFITDIGDSQTFGIFNTATNVIIERCTANNNRSFTNNGTALTQVIFNGASADNNISIDSCQIAGNAATATTGNPNAPISDNATLSGILVQPGITGAAINATIRNCTVINNNATINNPSGAQIPANCYAIIGTANFQNLSIENCVASNNSAAGFTVDGAGIFIQGNHVSIKNCDASSNTFISSAPAPANPGAIPGGIQARACQNVLIEDCTILNNQALAGSTQTNLAGIALSNTRFAAVRNCFVSGQTAANAITDVIGVIVNPGNNLSGDVVIENNVIENTVNTANSSQGIGVFFLGANRCQILNNSISGNAFGIALRPSAVRDTIECLVHGNKITANIMFGIQDSNTIKSNAYLHNVSYNPGGTNYGGLPPGTPVQVWALTSGTPPAAPTAGEIENISIQ